MKDERNESSHDLTYPILYIVCLSLPAISSQTPEPI